MAADLFLLNKHLVLPGMITKARLRRWKRSSVFELCLTPADSIVLLAQILQH
jgi:hypothetical protein